MERSEIASRMIAILTTALAEDPDSEAFDEQIADLLQGMHNVRLELPANAHPAAVAQAAMDEVTPSFTATIGTLFAAYIHLARAHDRTQPELSAQDILQDFALHFRIE
ncbi:hypothetical protein [Streptomyces sp. NPDC047014]|uniref:hypothetical protein n=1 Tax=Streptomyces sp. NPDC047014 TaxID=3155736 RepID=UPI0033E36824